MIRGPKSPRKQALALDGPSGLGEHDRSAELLLPLRGEKAGMRGATAFRRCLLPTTLLIAITLIGCGKGSAPTPKTAAIAPADPWVLTTVNPQGGAPAYLSNGLLGIRISRAGSGLGDDKKPTSFLMIDEYQPDGEEKILPLPNPVLSTLAVGNDLFEPGKQGHDFLKSGGTPLEPTAGKDYKQTVDMRTGMLTTEWNQDTPKGAVEVKIQTVVHPLERTIAQRWTLSTAKPVAYSLRTLDYGGPNDEQKPIGEDAKTGVTLSASAKRVVTTSWKATDSHVGARVQTNGFAVQEGTTLGDEPTIIERVISFGPHSEKPLPAFDPSNVGKLRAKMPAPRSFAEVEEVAKQWWSNRWKCDIEIDGPVEDQQAVRSFLFYLRSSINPQGQMAVSPFALSDTQYNGHVFWDADIWVFPGLALTDPDLAKAIPAYRERMFIPARTNFDKGISWPGADAAMADSWPTDRRWYQFPWESSVSGLETAPASSRKQHHVSGSALWAYEQARALDLVNDCYYYYRSGSGLAAFWDARMSPTEGHFKKPVQPVVHEIKDVMSPDENHVGDNDLYTNLLAQWTEDNFGIGGFHADKKGRRWLTDEERKKHGIPILKLPQDKTSFLTYDNDPIRGYKQAAAVLSIYPLQYPPAEKQARAMMERFSDKVIKNGPAMTDSVHSIIWSRLGEPEKAYVFWRGSWDPFTKNPLLLFSEKRGKPTSYFVTGAGGSLQSILYGFLGFRIDSSSERGAKWSQRLKGDSWLSVNPKLPKAWKSVTFKGFSVLGSRYTLTASSSGVRVKQGD